MLIDRLGAFMNEPARTLFERTTGDGRMAAPRALAALGALGQLTRLTIFQLLVRNEPSGLAAGAIAVALGCPHNTLSSHLAILARSGLVRRNRNGRTIIYRADVAGMRNLLTFLVSDCCDGHPEICALVSVIPPEDRSCAAPPKTRTRKK